MADDKLSITFSGSAAKLVGELNKLAIAANKSATKIAAAANKANAAMAKLGTSLGTNFTNTLKSAGIAVMRFSMILGGAFVAAAGAATREINKFNEALTEIGTLGVPTEDIERYRDALLDISTGTSESLVNLTEGLYQTISAGVTDATEAMKLLDVAQKAAIGGATDTATAVDALTIVFNSYSSELKTSEERLALVTRIGDTLNRTVDLGRTKFGELAASIGMVAGTAASAGLTIEEMTGTIAVLTRTLPNTAVATTALNNLLIKLVAPGDAAKEMAAELGIELGEAALKADGFAAKITEIIEKTGGSQEKMKALVEDTRALRAMTSIAGQGVDALTTAIAEMGFAAGSVDDDFKKMSETISFRLGRLRNVFVKSFEAGVTGSSDAIKDALEEIEGFFKEHGKGIVDTLTNVLMGFGKFVKFLVDNKGAIVAVLTAIFAASTFKFFIGGIVAAQQAFVNFGTAIKTSSMQGALNIGKITEAATKSKDSFAGAASGAAKIGVALMVIIPIMQKLSEAFHQFDRDMTVAFEDWVRGVEAGTLKAVTERDRILAEAAERERERRATLLDELSRMEYDAALEAAHAKLRAEDFAVTSLIAKRMALHEQLRKLREDSEARINDAMRRGGPERASAVKREIELEEKRLKEMVTSVTAEMNERKATATEIGEFIAILYEDQTAKFIEEAGKRAEVSAAEAELMGVKVSLIHARVMGIMGTALAKVREDTKKTTREVGKAFDALFMDLNKAFGAAFEFMLSESERLTSSVHETAAVLIDIAALSGRDLSIADAAVEAAGAAEKLKATLESIDIEDIVGDLGHAGDAMRSIADDAELSDAVSDEVSDGMQDGLERGVQSVEGIAKRIANAIRESLTQAAKQFGEKLAGFAQDVGNFFADFFVRGPMQEVMSLIQMATTAQTEDIVGKDGEIITEGFRSMLEETLQGFIDSIDNLVMNLPVLIDQLVAFLPKLVTTLVEAVPQIIETFVSNFPRIIDAIVEVIPQLTSGFADQLEPIIATLEQEMPRLGSALADGIKTSIEEFASSDWLPRIANVIFEFIGQILEAVISTLSDTMASMLRDLPDIILGLVDLIVNDLIGGLIAEIPELVAAFVEGIPEFIMEIMRGLPPIIMEFIQGIINALPLVIAEFVKSIPNIVAEFIRFILRDIPMLIVEMVRGFWTGLKEMMLKFWGPILRFFGIDIGGMSDTAPVGDKSDDKDYSPDTSQNVSTQMGRHPDSATGTPWWSRDNAHTGGLISLAGVQRFRLGGIVNAISRGFAQAAADNVPILAQAGEFVMSRNATEREGPAAMAAVNEGSASIGGEQVHYHFHAGSSVLVDSVRNLDSQMSELMDGGAGKTSAVMRKRSDPPIRKGQRFNQES